MSGRRALGALIGRFAARWRWRLAGGAGLVALALAMGAGLLAASGTLISGTALAGAGLMVFDTFRPSALVRLFAIGRTAARYAERLSTHDATLRFLADLRVAVFADILRQHRGDGRPALAFNRLTGDLEALDGVVIRLVVPVLAGAAVLAGAGLVLSVLSPALALGIVLPVALCGLAMPLAAAGAGARAARLKQYALDAARVRLIDLDRGRAELGAGGGMAAAQAGVVAAFARAAAAERQLARLDAAIRVVSGLGQQAATVAAVALGAPLQGAGLLSATGFAAVVLSSLALGEAVAPLRVLAMEYGRWTLAARRIVALERDGIAQMERVPAPPGWTIALAGISVRAEGALRDRLTGITLEVGRGARIALAGPSGGGKSSVIGVLAGLLPPTSGRVAGAPSVAWLGQRTELFRGTVADNLRLGRPEADAAALRAALEAVALGHVALDLHLGDGGAGLSGGERRRLALARTLLMEADLTLLDEPTEGLDAITAGVVFEAILARTAGRALVFATHREAEAAHADTVIVLRDGQIVRDQAGSGAPMRR